MTSAGKEAALAKSRDTTRAAIAEWHESRVKSLDADLTAQRAALFGLVERPDPARVDRMASHLLKHTPQDLAIFYNSASPAERHEMEAASAAIGRVPLKGPKGLEWTPMLDSVLVAEAQLTRADQTNPKAAQRLRELVEIRGMQETLTGVALSEV